MSSTGKDAGIEHHFLAMQQLYDFPEVLADDGVLYFLLSEIGKQNGILSYSGRPDHLLDLVK